MKQVVPSEELVAKCMFHPLPRLFADIGKARGGNVLGLDKLERNTLLWLYTMTSKAPEHEEFLHGKAAAYVAEMEAFARSIDASVS